MKRHGPNAVVRKDPFGVWSPHRDSHSVLSFKAMLGLRVEPWTWQDHAQQAAWWIIDGTRQIPEDLTAALYREKASSPTHGALLAPDWSAVQDPVWTFFKAPLQVNLVYRWIDACRQQNVHLSSLSGRQLKLRRWPNMTRYTANIAVADSIQLTVACARLLGEWTSYEQVIALVTQPKALDALLADAQREGILDIAPETFAVNAPISAQPKPTTLKERGAWSLVKSLIKKFT